MDMNQYLEIFIEESKEHLQEMNSSLLYLEGNPEDINVLNEIFRVAHTLKGMSATMGYNNIAHLTHEMENVLDFIRKGNMKVTSDVTDVLFECFDKLESYVMSVETNNNEGNDSSIELVEKLKALKNGEVSEGEEDPVTIDSTDPMINHGQNLNIQLNEYVNNVVLTAIKDDLNVHLVKITLDESCMLKSARAYIIITTLEKFADLVHSNPSIEEIEDEKFGTSFEFVLITKHDANFIKGELSTISEVANIEINPIGKENIETTDRVSEVPEESKPILNTLENNRNVESLDVAKNKESEDTKNKKTKTAKTVRVDIDRLDNLMNLVSELIIIKTRLEDSGENRTKQNSNEAIEYLERITTNLHDAVMKVRMVPIERVFNRFPRMVRDLSKDLGKDINLIMSGEETEVDRTVIDEIGDPLIHLIRNSIDHGIESIEKRIELGKQRTGTVKLSAYPDGNTVVIEVEDDGSGINVEKVKEKALSRELISYQESQLMDNKDIVQLLFAPGFSTAEQITDISGRGVGLDVVKTKIEALGGVVEADTTLGKGTKFIIRLPLTLAIIQALLVVVGDEKYAIPLNSIKEITTIEKNKIRKVQKKEVVLYRDSTLPILRLSELLNVPASTNSSADEEEDDLTVVIVKKGDRDAGIIVDRLIGQQEIVIKSLGKYLSTIKSIAGATILGNGSVALIVDTNSFF